MQCLELQEVMRSFIDGQVDGETRRQVGLHLADCPECMNLINGDSFWDDAVVSLLDREAPADLRADILGDLAEANPAPHNAKLSGLGWQKQMKIIGWASLRNNNPRQWLTTTAVVIAIIVAVQVVLHLLK